MCVHMHILEGTAAAFTRSSVGPVTPEALKNDLPRYWGPRDTWRETSNL